MGLIQYGNIVLVSLYPVTGREVSNTRPAVIISNNVLNEDSPYVIVAPISSNVVDVLAFHLFVQNSKQNGLKVDSKIMPETFRSIDKIRVVKKLGHLEDRYMELLEGKILYVLNQNSVP